MVLPAAKRSSLVEGASPVEEASDRSSLNTPLSLAKKPDIPVLDKKRAPSAVGHSKRQRKRSELDIMEEFETGPGILSSATSTEMTSASKSAAVASAEDHEVLQPTPESNWRETIDGSSGKPYFYHIITNEVTWDKPACLVALVDDLCPSSEPAKKAKGIWWDKRSGKWRTEISIAGKRKHIGYFSAHEEATAAFSFVRKALDGCGLSEMDDGRFAVYENAKVKAIEAAILGSSSNKTKGIHQERKSGRWVASISIKGASKYIGTFDTSDEASAARQLVSKALGYRRGHDSAELETLFQAAKTKARGEIVNAGDDADTTDGKRPQKTKGIYQRRDTGRWVALINFNGVSRNIGTFDTSAEASAAFQLVSKALGVRRGRDGAELVTLFQAARKKARGEVVNAGVDDDLDDSDRPRKKRVPHGFKRGYEAGREAETQTETVTANDKIALGSGIRVIGVRHGTVPDTRIGGTTAAITPTSTLPPKHTETKALSGVGTFSIGDGMDIVNKVTPEQLSQQDPERLLASPPTTGPKPATPAKKPDIPVLDQQPAPRAAGHSKRQHKKSELDILEEYDERCKMQQVKSNILSSFRSTEIASARKPASAAYTLVSEALGARKCGRDSAELKASFQAAKATAAGLKDVPGTSESRAREAADADTKAITSSQNAKGYYQRRDTGKWDAQIKLKGKSKGIGSFATPEGASAAYQIVRDKLDDVNSSINDDELEALFQASKKKAREEVMHSGVDIIPPDSDWRETIDDSSGNPYYYHIVTNEVTWDKPASVAALDDLTLLLRGGGTNANDPTSNDPPNATVRLDSSPLADDHHSRDTISPISNSTVPQPYTARARKGAGADTNASACTAIHETKGVHYRRTSGKWQAQISIEHVYKYIGTFSTSEEAFAAYQIVRIELGDIDVVRNDDELERLFQAAKKKANNWIADAGFDVDSADGKRPQKAKGIHQRRDTGRWVAKIAFNGVSKNIGTFSTSEEASAAYQLVRDAFGHKSGRDSAELEALFQAARKKARGEVVNGGVDADTTDGKRPQKTKILLGAATSGRAESPLGPDNQQSKRQRKRPNYMDEFEMGEFYELEAAKAIDAASTVDLVSPARPEKFKKYNRCTVSGCTKYRQTRSNGMCRKHFLATKESRSIHEPQGYSERPDGKVAVQTSVNGTTRNIGSEEASDANQLVRDSDRKRGRDSAELEASFQDARKKARGES